MLEKKKMELRKENEEKMRQLAKLEAPRGRSSCEAEPQLGTSSQTGHNSSGNEIEVTEVNTNVNANRPGAFRTNNKQDGRRGVWLHHHLMQLFM